MELEAHFQRLSDRVNEHLSEFKGTSLAVAELGVELKMRRRDFGELTHDDLKEKLLHVEQQVTSSEEWGNDFTTNLNVLEVRVDNLEQWGEELATSSCVLTKLQSPFWIVPRSIRSWHDLSRTWSNGVMRSRIVSCDLLMIVSRTWSNAGLEECTASPGRDTSTGCSGWSRLCDHAAAVPAVRRVLRAFGSVPRQNGGHSSCMSILVRIVHTVQQTVDFHRYSSLDGCGCACCCAMTGAWV